MKKNITMNKLDFSFYIFALFVVSFFAGAIVANIMILH